MNKVTLFLLCILLATQATAQQDFNDSIARSRNQITKTAMVVLGSWGTANIATGFILAGRTTGETKYMWQMNAYWNLFNLGLAGLGYAGIHKASSKRFGFNDNYKAQQGIEKLYAFNAGLDLAYIAGGFYLRERGKNESAHNKAAQWRGYGTSIAIQGAFLLVMDAVMLTVHHKNTKKMNSKLEQLELKSGPGGLGISYTF